MKYSICHEHETKRTSPIRAMPSRLLGLLSYWETCGELPCGTKFSQVLILRFSRFFHDPLKGHCKNFLRKNLLYCRNYVQTSLFTYNVKIFRDCLVIADKVLMVNIDCGSQIDSQDEVECRCKKGNGSDNSGDNATSCTIFIAETFQSNQPHWGKKYFIIVLKRFYCANSKLGLVQMCITQRNL